MNTPKDSFGRSSNDALSLPALKGGVSRAKAMKSILTHRLMEEDRGMLGGGGASPQKLQTQFQALKNSISQDGCSDDLAVCDQRPLIDLYENRHLVSNPHVEKQIADLYESMDDTGCEYPYTVVEVNPEDFDNINEYFTK